MATRKTSVGVLLEIDLHDMALWQAKDRIREELNKAVNGEEAGLYLIHGFNSGDRIKTYIRGGALANSMKDRGISAKIVRFKGNLGTTGIILVEPDIDA
jgi:hypothetical protein